MIIHRINAVYILLAIFFLSIPYKVSSQSKKKVKSKMICVGFYNLENLFDIYDDPESLDEEFTPSGAKVWTKDKYEDKINRLSSVIKEFGSDHKLKGADILGVCEIENRQVLEDLTAHEQLRSMDYAIIHHESFDPRGIDLALLYKPSVFVPTYSGMSNIKLSSKTGNSKPTRGVLVVQGILGGQKVCILVNHWPSRRGGEGATRDFRNQAASANRHIADSIQTNFPGTAVIIMGDLNDDPINESVKNGLKSVETIESCTENKYFNPFYKNYQNGEGTLAHNNSWNLFDQIILSYDFISQNQKGYHFFQNKVYRQDFMIESHGHYKNHPKRTFSGDVYNYGYSDHFPVLVYLVQKIK
ncbi:MAG: endonuclease/exonuclease/phosphatase family protein [Saprospiraceae bacterium]|nr:endonuclease/exonuclease/phosphatase family protein [Saprospiraceae bacterium]